MITILQQAKNRPVTIRNPVTSLAVPENGLRSGVAYRIPLRENGERDEYQIIATLNQLARIHAQQPEIREFANRILSPDISASVTLDPMSQNDERFHYRVILDFVKERIRYVKDPVGGEYIQGPLKIIREIMMRGYAIGDCDDHVLFFNSLLMSVGIPAKVIGVVLNNANRFNHVISSVYIGGEWIDTDPCAKGFMQPNYQRRLE